MKNILPVVFICLFGCVSLFSQNINAVVITAPAEIAGTYPAIRAQFGSQSDDIVKGYGQFVKDNTTNPTYGCSDLLEFLETKIAFIDRGTCEFGLKALNAQKKGAIAAVICNGLTGTEPFSMPPGTYGSQVVIPTFMMSNENCQKIRAHIMNGNVEIGLEHTCISKADYPLNTIWGNVQGQGDFYHGLNGWTVENPISDTIGWGFVRDGYILPTFGGGVAISAWSTCDGAASFESRQWNIEVDSTICKYFCGGLISPVIELSGLSLEGLSIEFFQSTEHYLSTYQLLVSYDEGATWPHKYILNDTLQYREQIFQGRTKVMMKEYVGQKNIRFKFEHQSWSGYWGIDDVFLVNEKINSNKDIEAHKSVHMWPNPASDRIHMSLKEPIQKLDLIGSDGRLLSTLGYVSIANNDASIDVSYLPNGIYFAKVRTHSGMFVEQFVVVK